MFLSRGSPVAIPASFPSDLGLGHVIILLDASQVALVVRNLSANAGDEGAGIGNMSELTGALLASAQLLPFLSN